MDQNELYEIETSRKSNKYYLFMKKTFRFLVPVSLVSFLLSYSTGFSFFFTYNLRFSTLDFPLFAHALERKYMFLICNGILAFLVKTLNFSSSSPSISDFNDHEDSMIKSTTDVNEKLVPESTVADTVVAGEEEVLLASPEKTAKAEKDEPRLQEKGHEEVTFTSQIDDGRRAGGLIILDNKALETIDVEEELKEEKEDMEEGEGLLGASAAEEEEEVANINTEELNKKFEEFIRKMKEEIRIQAQQPQLITV